MTAAEGLRLDDNTSQRRVVITGIGAVTSIGIGAEGLWRGVKCARSGVGTIRHFDASSLPCRIAAEVHDFDPTPNFEAKALKRVDRPVQFAIASSRQAVADARRKMQSG